LCPRALRAPPFSLPSRIPSRLFPLSHWQAALEVENTIKRIASHKGVEGILIAN
jgi:dynein light chain roadblock-type